MRVAALLSLTALAAVATPTATAQAQAPSPLTPRGMRVRTVTDTIVGAVGGVAVDASGIIYVATFGDVVYKGYPDGRKSVFATGLYSASGNAIDSKGRLLQANFVGNSISRIDRQGNVSEFATGLNGPVGIAVDSADNLVVCNCRANTLSRVTAEGVVSTWVESPLLNCPNGITRGPDGTYYVVNFRDSRVLAISSAGRVREVATLPGGGNGHVAMARGDLYVTSFQGHMLFRVTLDGKVTQVAGTGRPGEVDGVAGQSQFTFPNGIAAGPTGDRLYVNDYINRFPTTVEAPPVPKSTLRQLTLPPFGDILLTAHQVGGIDSLEAAYRAWKTNPATAGLFTELEVNALGYGLMGAGKVKDAIRVFELNVASYPTSFNTYDSLAEAYMTDGQHDKAVEFYKKSLAKNPANSNATQMLKKLGAD